MTILKTLNPPPEKRVGQFMRILLLLLLLWMPVQACLNLKETTLDGRSVTVEGGPGESPASMFAGQGREEWEERLRQLEAKDSLIDTRNDRGVCLAHLGRAQEALILFQGLERETPGQYATAANLGTCYELTGRDQEALKWIRRGIELNPDSHQGSEWLHVKILEAKLKMAGQPDWLKTHTVLGYDFGDDLKPKLPPELATEEARRKALSALEYQLSERVPLVAARDPVVADLLFALSNLHAIDTSVERGREFLRFALPYHPTRADLGRRRLQYYDRLLADKSPIGSDWWRPALGVGGLLVLFIALHRRSARRF